MSNRRCNICKKYVTLNSKHICLNNHLIITIIDNSTYYNDDNDFLTGAIAGAMAQEILVNSMPIAPILAPVILNQYSAPLNDVNNSNFAASDCYGTYNDNSNSSDTSYCDSSSSGDCGGSW